MILLAEISYKGGKMKKKFEISAHFTFKEYKNEEAKKNRSIQDKDVVFSEKKLKESLELMRELGIKKFNTWIHSSIYTDFSVQKKEVKVMEEYLKKYSDIKVSSLHYNGSIFDLDEKTNKKNREQLKNYIELVKDLKPETIVIHPGVFGEGGFSHNLPNYQKAVQELGEIGVKNEVAKNIRYFGEEAKKYGIKIAVENIFKGRVYSRIPDLIDLVEIIDLENVGYCLDIGHGNYDEIDIVETIKIMGDKLFELHLSDNAGDRDAHLPIGFGTVNWNEVIATLREIDYKGNATFEFFRWPIENKKLGLQLAILMWKTLENIEENGYHTLDYL